MKINAILRNVPYVAFDTLVSWTDAATLSRDEDKTVTRIVGNYRDDAIKRIASERVAQFIANKVNTKGTWSITDEPEGRVFRVRGYWHSYDELLKLLETAYYEGYKQK